MNILEIKNLCKSYNKNKVLENFSMELEQGKIISIIGASGAGKTTLLRCINKLEKIDSGEILIDGLSINKSNLKIGLVFQEYNLFPQYSVIDNVILPLRIARKMDKDSSKKIAIDILKQLNLEEKQNSYPYELSGGQKQRLAIARTLALNPDVICFDEPTSALDPSLIKQVTSIIKELAESGKGIIIVTHDMKFATDISDRIIEIKK